MGTAVIYLWLLQGESDNVKTQESSLQGGSIYRGPSQREEDSSGHTQQNDPDGRRDGGRGQSAKVGRTRCSAVTVGLYRAGVGKFNYCL